jgi:hypothetical protein
VDVIADVVVDVVGDGDVFEKSFMCSFVVVVVS